MLEKGEQVGTFILDFERFLAPALNPHELLNSK